MFRFASPYFLFLLALIPLAVFCQNRRRTRPAMGISAVAAVLKIKGSLWLRLRPVLPALKYMGMVLLIIAMARPQWGTSKQHVQTEGVNIILAVDLSESMAALDFKQKGKIVNRLEAVKEVVRTFVAKRSGDRIGMVVFGSHAYTQVPLTRDYSTIVSVLHRLKIGGAGKSTAIGDAIGISLKRLEDIKSKSNIIILLTDGRSNAGEFEPSTTAGIAVQKKVKVYTVGVGTRGRVPFLIKDAFLGDRYVYQRVDIDEDTLRDIAAKTGGLYFRAENMEGLEKIYETIDKLEKTKVTVVSFEQYNEFYVYFLVMAFIALGLWLIFLNTRFLEIP